MTAKTQNISKYILTGLMVAGVVVVASASPVFVSRLVPMILKELKYRKRKRDREKSMRKYYHSFYYLRRKGLLNMEYRGKQMHISLTKEGKKMVEKYSIDDLKIEKAKKWDRKWRVMIFDISEKKRASREALRGKLKELGLYQLQKSVWVCPYNFRKEMEVLKSFFGFSAGEFTTFMASELEDKREKELLNHFKLNKKK